MRSPTGANKGIEVVSGQIMDMMEKGVVEPIRVKLQAIKSASEAAEMIPEDRRRHRRGEDGGGEEEGGEGREEGDSPSPEF